MVDVIRDLQDLLSHHLVGYPYNSNSTLRERFLIDHLTEEVRRWEVGSNSYEELREIFAEHDLGLFDLDAWIASKAAEGEYFLPDELQG